MILLWILGIILGILLLLFLVLCQTRLQVLMTMRASELTLDLRAGLLRLRLYPREKEKPEAEEKRKKKEREKPEKAPSRSRPVPTWEDLRDALHALPPPLRRAFLRILRGIRVSPLSLAVTFGGWDDPPAAAEAYGTACAVLGTAMPLAERALTVPDPDIRLDIDFTAPKTRAEGTAGISARIGTLLSAGTCVAIPTLLWLRRVSRRSRKAEPERDSGKRKDAANRQT